MNKLALLLLGAIIPLLGIQGDQNRKQQNRGPVIASFYSSASTVVLCPRGFSYGSACISPDLTLSVAASDPDSDVLRYEYSSSVGKIVGKGSSVRWNLHNIPIGIYTASVKVKDGKGGENRALLTVTIENCTSCDPPRLPCPEITVSCRNRAGVGKLVVFSATAKGTKPYRGRSYAWVASGGRIVSGQNTRHIEVDITGLQADNITATVDVGGFDPACSREASCSLVIKH
jgi:hypothetical protein